MIILTKESIKACSTSDLLDVFEGQIRAVQGFENVGSSPMFSEGYREARDITINNVKVAREELEKRLA